MGRKRTSKGSGSSVNECKQALESVLQLSAQDDLARREFSLALKGLRNQCQQGQKSFTSQDEWLLRVEQSAAQLHEACETFDDDSSERRIEIYCLLQTIQESSRVAAKATPIDPTRVMLVCLSFVASYRLQSQMDEQVMDEIRSFLSTLYLNIDFDAVSSQSSNDKPGMQNTTARIDEWIDHIESRAFLNSTPWLEALREMQRLLDSSGRSDSKHYHALDKPVHIESQSELVSKEDVPLPFMNPVVDCDSALSVVESFLGKDTEAQPASIFVLVAGPQGSGKTFLCDEIENKVRLHGSSVQVVRPNLPIDLMGASLGETEDTIVSMFEFARRCQKCILLFDDIDRVLVQDEADAPAVFGSLQTDAQPHSQTRLFAAFLSQVDSLQAHESAGDNQILIVGTASRCDKVSSIRRVDKMYFLEQPNETERRDIIVRSLGLDTGDASMNLALLTDLVDCTVGRSRSELVQYCRHAVASSSVVSASASSTDLADSAQSEAILRSMKASLQSLAPESLRTGAVSDFVDMRVLSARDLNARDKPDSDELQLPLFGNDAREAWNEMKALIVTPLCQANALDELLYGDHHEDRKRVCGGVLLVGNPGCGKSCLAYHCARVAANLIPSVNLLDVSCTSLVQKAVGGSERALRHLFESAKAAAPCILLMDGIENIAAVRGHDNTTEGTMDRILSTLLVELDGVESQSNAAGKIAVIAITHNEEWIDPALRRPGRLEKVIKLRSPCYDARYEIVNRELRSVSIPKSQPMNSTNELASFVAGQTDGMSGAEVLALCREARMESARECIQQNKDLNELDGCVTREHFIAAGLSEA